MSRKIGMHAKQHKVIDPAGKLRAATVEVEELGELFLINRDKIVACDTERQANREALTALRKQRNSLGGSNVNAKCWLNSPASGFVKLPTDAAMQHLSERGEALEQQMQQLRQEQKLLVLMLADKGASPEELGEGLLAALLHLKDTPATCNT